MPPMNVDLLGAPAICLRAGSSHLLDAAILRTGFVVEVNVYSRGF